MSMSFLIGNYSSNDNVYASEFNKRMVDIINVDANGEILDTNTASNLTHMAYPGYTVDDLMTIENNFNDMEVLYNEATSIIKVGNDLQNVNTYLSNSYNAESNRVNSLLSHSMNDVYLSRENYMLKKYATAYNQYLAKVVMFSFFIAIVCAFVILFTKYEKVKLTWSIAGGLLTFILSIYVLGVVMFYKQMLLRRKDDWTKYYFSSPDGLNTAAASCPSASQ